MSPRWTASIARWPRRRTRPCLLALKIVTLLGMKDMQGLEDTVTTFVKVAPNNPLAHTFAAMLESRKHRCPGSGGRDPDGDLVVERHDAGRTV